MINSGVKTTVVDVRTLAPGIRSFCLKTPEPVRWMAGQYAMLSFGGFNPRPYSIANAPGSEAPEIHVRNMGGASAYAVENLREGDEVAMDAVQGGSFFNPATMRKKSIVLIAGGMGITPMKAIAESALPLGFSVHLHWGVRGEGDLYLRSHFQAMEERHENFCFIPDIGGRIGERVAADHESFTGCEIFLAGPPQMIDATLSLLLDRGVAMESVHFDGVEGGIKSERRAS